MIGWSDAESKTRDDTERDPQDARLSSRRFWILSNPLCLLEFTGAMHDRDRTSLATAARSADRSRADRGAAPGNRPCRVHNPRHAEAPVMARASQSTSAAHTSAAAALRRVSRPQRGTGGICAFAATSAFSSPHPQRLAPSPRRGPLGVAEPAPMPSVLAYIYACCEVATRPPCRAPVASTDLLEQGT